MSVIVKDMGMPENCMDCKIKQYDEFENYHVCPFSGVMCLSIGRQDACPLVALPDKHGRLVDADATIKEIKARNPDDVSYEDAWAITCIEHAPTIEPEPHWIPCSERLPKEEDYRECMECLDGAVWYYTDRKTMGLGYYYDSTKQWSTICDMKPDGKVIAWKPLPELYREGEG